MIDQRNQNITWARAIKDFYLGIFDVRGYTTRAGFWKATIFSMIVSSIMQVIALGIEGEQVVVESEPYITRLIEAYSKYGMVSLLIIVISLYFIGIQLTMAIRRCRDVGLNTLGCIIIAGTPFIFLTPLKDNMVLCILCLLCLIVSGFFASNSLIKYHQTPIIKYFIQNAE